MAAGFWNVESNKNVFYARNRKEEEKFDSFYQRLKQLREERRLNVKEAAKLIGVPMTTYRDWEYGRAVTGETYVKISKEIVPGFVESGGSRVSASYATCVSGVNPMV
jgi:DNA-binding XRE family transcriptional regulator